MKIQNVGILSPGDMGQAIAQQLKQKGFNIYTALDKRSARTKSLAQQAGITDVGSMAKLTEQCDVIMSVLNPAAALELADEVAQAINVSQRQPLFVDCNAIAPQCMHAIAEKINAAGGRCIDGGLTGQPPRGTGKTHLYVSGPAAHELEQLSTPQMTVRVLSERIGDASSIKMCYGALRKGTTGLVLELLVAARRLGVADALETQIKETQNALYEMVLGGLPVMAPKARRWVPEMLEIAQTFKSVGLTPRVFEGIHDVYEFVAANAIGKETPENRDKSRSGKDVIRLLADGGQVKAG